MRGLTITTQGFPTMVPARAASGPGTLPAR
jgi:hypothetical protein